MVIFPAHILTMAMRTSGWGDGGDCEEGEKWEAQGDACCFLEKERIEGGVKDEKRRRHRDMEDVKRK